MTYVLVIIIVILIAALPITWKAAIDRKTKDDAAKIGTAEEKARTIIDDALKTAETKKREALLEVKEQSLAAKNEVDREIKDRRAEISKQERRIQSKEDTLDRKMDAMEKRESDFATKEAELKKKQKKVDELHDDAVRELERIAGMTTDEAKEFLYNKVQDDVKVDVAKLYRELVEKAKDDAGKKAKEIVVNSIQRCAVDHVSETTISVVQLPNDEMKGRIIGREGRNIRTIETMTGVDLIIDDTPEAVVLSGFDPIRREIARIALEKLIVDGRIHPARIEEMVEKARKEVEARMREDGEAAAFEVGVHNLHPELPTDRMHSSIRSKLQSSPDLWQVNADAISEWQKGRDFFMISESRSTMRSKAPISRLVPISAGSTRRTTLLSMRWKPIMVMWNRLPSSHVWCRRRMQFRQPDRVREERLWTHTRTVSSSLRISRTALRASRNPLRYRRDARCVSWSCRIRSMTLRWCCLPGISRSRSKLSWSIRDRSKSVLSERAGLLIMRNDKKDRKEERELFLFLSPD